jgi:hypothetical protein
MNDELLERHAAMYAELESLIEVQNEDVLTLKERGDEIMVKVQDDEGEVEIKEAILWQEMFHLGIHGNRASDILRAKYPEVFERQEAIDKLRMEAEQFEVQTFGFLLKTMTPPNMIKLIKLIAGGKK